MRQLEELGTPTIMVVPNGMHRSDCAVWKERFPDIRVVCPAAAKSAVEAVVPIDATCEQVESPAFGVPVVVQSSQHSLTSPCHFSGSAYRKRKN